MGSPEGELKLEGDDKAFAIETPPHEVTITNRLTSEDAHFGQFGEGKMNRPREVGGGVSNAFGLYDMHGNVSQWCSDWYRAYPATAQTDPEGPDAGRHGPRVYRGGSCSDSPRLCRSAYRVRYDQALRSGNLGFRLALIPSGQDK
jgi:formylglycine-generating enzyme required for sulfatase activity